MPAARALLFSLLILATPLSAVLLVRAEEYTGKTVRIMVGASAGGGYDREARLLARHLGRHLPGTPRVVVDDVPGAGGLVAASTFARVTPPDGLTIGYFPFGVMAAQVLGQTATQYDVRQFEILGSPYADRHVCAFSVSTGITSIERWRAMKRPVRLGSTGRDSIMYVFPSMLKAALGLNAEIITGYKGSTEVRLAITTGELDGACIAWGGLKAGWPDRRGLAVVLQSGSESDPELRDVPLALASATTPAARALLGPVATAMSVGGRLYAFPPRTPPHLTAVMAGAFLATVRDPAYVQEARGANIANEFTTAADMRVRMDALFALPADVLALLRRAVGN